MNKVGYRGDYKDGRWALVDKEGHPLTAYKYWFVEPINDGYFRAQVTGGSCYNILRPDGSEVLSENCYWVGNEIHEGFFFVGQTKRKTKTTPTQYLTGIAHISGDYILPVMNCSCRWFYKLLDENNQDIRWDEIPEDKTEDDYTRKYFGIGIEVDGKSYAMYFDGTIYDLSKSHLPNKLKLDEVSFFEKLVNWTLPGLQFFYRDTDADIDAAKRYHVGDTIRAGILVDVTTKLQRPIHKTRYIIASAHAAMFCEIEDMVANNPDIRKWGLCTLHFNSYFKVLDVYQKGGVTQVLLLHIPEAAARYMGKSELLIHFTETATKGMNLVEMARESLNEKLRMDVHPRSYDFVLCHRMHLPIGLDENGQFVPLPPMDDSYDTELHSLSEMIHKLAKDYDIDGFVEEVDNFPFIGVSKSICEGCIYASGIKGNGECCGRLDKEEFRKHYISADCDYRKESEDALSWYEYKQKQEQEAADRKANPLKEATNIVKQFIEDKLNGDIDNLLSYNFADLNEDESYGNCRGYAFSPEGSEIVRAILTLVFDGVWGDYAFKEQKSKVIYRGCRLNSHQRLLGSSINGEYFMGLQKMNPSTELVSRANAYYANYYNNIGNMVLLPAALDILKDNSTIKGYMDYLLEYLYTYLTEPKKVPYKVLDQIRYCKKSFTNYQGSEGFEKLVNALLLTDFVDDNLKPKEVFIRMGFYGKNVTQDLYLEAVKRYLDFHEKYIPTRAQLIVDILKVKLGV